MVFKKSDEKLQGSLQIHENKGYFTGISVCVYHNIALNLCWNQKYFKVVENIKTHFMFNKFFSPKIRAVKEIMGKNSFPQDRPHI